MNANAAARSTRNTNWMPSNVTMFIVPLWGAGHRKVRSPQGGLAVSVGALTPGYATEQVLKIHGVEGRPDAQVVGVVKVHEGVATVTVRGRRPAAPPFDQRGPPAEGSFVVAVRAVRRVAVQPQVDEVGGDLPEVRPAGRVGDDRG